MSFADEDAAAVGAEHDLVGRGGADPGEVGLGEGDAAPLRHLAAQESRADSVASALLLVELHQVGRDLLDERGAVAGERLLLVGELLRLRVALLGEGSEGGQDLVALGLRGGDLGLDALDPLHQGELDVLEVAATLDERGDLALQRGDVLRGRRGLQAVAVAGEALVDDLDVGLDAAELGAGVLQPAVALREGAAGLVVAGLHRLDRRDLRQGGDGVTELVAPRVETLQSQELSLVGGAGNHVAVLVPGTEGGRAGSILARSRRVSGRSRNPRGRCGSR